LFNVVIIAHCKEAQRKHSSTRCNRRVVGQWQVQLDGAKHIATSWSPVPEHQLGQTCCTAGVHMATQSLTPRSLGVYNLVWPKLQEGPLGCSCSIVPSVLLSMPYQVSPSPCWPQANPAPCNPWCLTFYIQHLSIGTLVLQLVKLQPCAQAVC
jgi:hypothetical protein